MNSESLKLENQICFPFYAISNAIIRKYGPFLKELELTYPQYLVLLVLWENNERSVGDICTQLHLKTNTLTPLLQKLDKKGLIARTRSGKDSRKVIIALTSKAVDLRKKAECIPKKILESSGIEEKELLTLHKLLAKFLTDIQKS